MSEYLDEEEQLARLKSWWDDNGVALVLGLVVAVVGIVGWNWYSNASIENAQAQTQLLQEYQAAEGEQRETLGETLAADYPGSSAHVFVLFDQAKTAVSEGEFDTAQNLLSQAVEVSDDELLVDLARIRLARVQRQVDLGDDALATLALVRNEGYKALALETQGDIHASYGDVEQAHLAYQAAVDSLPEGDNRPLLAMKLENSAPFAGEYVEMTDQLTEALKEAASTLDAQVPTQESAADSGGALDADAAESAKVAEQESISEESSP